MKKLVLGCATLFAVWSLSAADSKEEVTAAAKKLNEQANYSWKTTIAVPENAPYQPGPTEGKCEKGGYLDIKLSISNNSYEILKKDNKAVFTTMDGEWYLTTDPEIQSGPGRFIAGVAQGAQPPVDQAVNLAAAVVDFKADGEAVGGDLPEDTVKKMMHIRRGGDGQSPAVSGAKGSAKFWVKDGILVKYQFTIVGNLNVRGTAINQDRTTTIEIKDIGTTKIQVPDAAKKKLEPTDAPK